MLFIESELITFEHEVGYSVTLDYFYRLSQPDIEEDIGVIFQKIWEKHKNHETGDQVIGKIVPITATETEIGSNRAETKVKRLSWKIIIELDMVDVIDFTADNTAIAVMVRI